MSVKSASKSRSALGLGSHGKYDIQITWFVIVSLLLAATMAVSSAEPINTKPRAGASPLPLLLEQAVASKESSTAPFQGGI